MIEKPLVKRVKKNNLKLMDIITNGNAKGGHVKSTTTCCLGYLLNYELGLKVLIIDLDSQDQDRLFF